MKLSLLFVSILALFCFESNAQNTCTAAITAGLVAYYPFCNSANDVSGNNLNGTVNGATLSIDRFGNANSCYNFNGTSNYIQIANNALLNFGTGDFSISAWVNTTLSTSEMILHKGEGYNYPQYFLRLHDSPSADVLLLTSAGSVATESSTGNCTASTISNGQWHHVVAIRNAGTLILYFDGTQIYSASATVRNVDNAFPLLIGAQNASTIQSTPIGNFFNGKLDDIYIFNRALTAGEVTSLFNPPSTCNAWANVGSGTNAAVRDFVVDTINNILYVGGSFTTAGGNSANYIAKWDGTTWSALGIGIGGNYVQTLAMYNGELYAGGQFTTAGGNSTTNIAKWNGTTWTAVGTGVNNIVTSLAVYNGNLYVGGLFSTAGGNPANYIAKWNGTTWTAVGTGMSGGTTSVNGLCVYNASLIAGGDFTTAGGSSASNMAQWNGTIWSPLGSGTNSWVGEVTVNNGNLYVGGNFTTAGGSSANYMAKWNGTNWSALGSGMNGWVQGLTSYNGNIIAGGSFTTADGNSSNNIAKWNGTSWSAIGTGMNNAVVALSVYKNELYAGGSFTTADGNAATYIAKWASTPTVTTSGATTICSGNSATLTSGGANTYAWSTGATTASISVTPTTTTSYTVTGTIISGCSNTVVSIVNVNQLPATPTINANMSTLTSSASTGNQWYLNGNPIASATAQTYSVTQNGVYTVCVTDANSCSVCSSPYTFSVTGLTEQTSEMNISVFPNPTSENLNINFIASRDEKIIVQVINTLGQVVKSIDMGIVSTGQSTKTLNLAELSRGIYCLKISGSDFRRNLPVIIEK